MKKPEELDEDKLYFYLNKKERKKYENEAEAKFFKRNRGLKKTLDEVEKMKK